MSPVDSFQFGQYWLDRHESFGRSKMLRMCPMWALVKSYDAHEALHARGLVLVSSGVATAKNLKHQHQARHSSAEKVDALITASTSTATSGFGGTADLAYQHF